MFRMQKTMTEVKREKSRGKKISLSSYSDFSGPASTPMMEELIGAPLLVFVYLPTLIIHPAHWECKGSYWQTVPSQTLPLHNVYFVKYDATVSFLAQVLDTVAYFFPCISNGYSDIFWHILVVDTVTYFGGNHGSRVWKSLKLKKVYFPRTRTIWDKYMFNRIVFFKF